MLVEWLELRYDVLADDDAAAQLRIVATAAGLRLQEDGGVVSREVIGLARSGDRLGAIRRFRQESGASLIVAKRVVDAVTA